MTRWIVSGALVLVACGTQPGNDGGTPHDDRDGTVATDGPRVDAMDGSASDGSDGGDVLGTREAGDASIARDVPLALDAPRPMQDTAHPMSLIANAAATFYLQDSDTWATYAANMAPVAAPTGHTNPVTADAILHGALDQRAAVSTVNPEPAPGVVHFVRRLAWEGAEATATYSAANRWDPQGVTTAPSTLPHALIVSWHDYYGETRTHDSQGASITLVDGTTGRYRRVLLVEPTSPGSFVSQTMHAGGVARSANLLYVAYAGLRVYDLSRIYEVTHDDNTPSGSARCAGHVGRIGAGTAASPYAWCAYGYRYVLPQVSYYGTPHTVACTVGAQAGHCYPETPTVPIAGTSFAGIDSWQSDEAVLTGEFCDGTDAYPCPTAPTTAWVGRLFRWPVDASTHRLATDPTTHRVYVQRGYVMNTAQVQGVSTARAYARAPYGDSYMLSSGAWLTSADLEGRRQWTHDARAWTAGNEGMVAEHDVPSADWYWTATEFPNGSFGRGLFVTAASQF